MIEIYPILLWLSMISAAIIAVRTIMASMHLTVESKTFAIVPWMTAYFLIELVVNIALYLLIYYGMSIDLSDFLNATAGAWLVSGALTTPIPFLLLLYIFYTKVLVAQKSVQYMLANFLTIPLAHFLLFVAVFDYESEQHESLVHNKSLLFKMHDMHKNESLCEDVMDDSYLSIKLLMFWIPFVCVFLFGVSIVLSKIYVSKYVTMSARTMKRLVAALPIQTQFYRGLLGQIVALFFVPVISFYPLFTSCLFETYVLGSIFVRPIFFIVFGFSDNRLLKMVVDIVPLWRQGRTEDSAKVEPEVDSEPLYSKKSIWNSLLPKSFTMGKYFQFDPRVEHTSSTNQSVYVTEDDRLPESEVPSDGKQLEAAKEDENEDIRIVIDPSSDSHTSKQSAEQ